MGRQVNWGRAARLGAVSCAASVAATVSVLHAIPGGLGADVVDVYAGRTLLVEDLTPGTLTTVQVRAGTYRIDVVRAGTRRAVMAPPTVTIRNSPGTQDMGTNTIVYLWGSAADGRLRQAVQNVRIDLR